MPEPSVPEKVRAEVIRELYRQVDTLDWEELPARAKTAYYTRWVEDDAIGGVLADYMTSEGMRVWLKDGPLKEYARAVESFGSYAQYVSKHLTPPSEFLFLILGSGWRVRPETIREKPMHCKATDGSRERYVCWGRVRNFRDLVWAALNEAVDSAERPLIVVYGTDDVLIDADRSRRFRRIAEHCGLDVGFVRREWLAAAAG
ncbi:hypothetical protein [Micromonospora sp. NPDC051006]|uniref:hypothetical protein n=1 Tax=Micromonospora sp. NPDC051006 TaxID=3364283 RepID=UPI0037AF98CF